MESFHAVLLFCRRRPVAGTNEPCGDSHPLPDVIARIRGGAYPRRTKGMEFTVTGNDFRDDLFNHKDVQNSHLPLSGTRASIRRAQTRV